MSESIVPSNRDLWDSVNHEGQHHYPPCKPAADLQKTMLSSLAAALIALLAAVGNIIMEFIRR